MKRIIVYTEHPIALETKDTTEPRGAQNDNSKNDNYIDQLISKHHGRIAYMDLGCAGGGFVSQMLQRGQIAVGLEGCDHNLKEQRHEWPDIPQNLFTCDITKTFGVKWEHNLVPIKFDVISAFDVLEHIQEQDLPQLLTNIKTHLQDGGHLVCSIATFEDAGYHVTIKPEDWWDELFSNHGMIKVDDLISTYGRTSSFQRTYKLKSD